MGVGKVLVEEEDEVIGFLSLLPALILPAPFTYTLLSQPEGG